MDAISNPFAPGAGSQPPELAGRSVVLEAAGIALQRAIKCRHDKSQILLGLRGTGKTVLLNKIEDLAETCGHLTSFVEAPEDDSLPQLLYPKIHQVLKKLSSIEAAKSLTHTALSALRGFASVFKIEYGDVSIAVDAEPGLADSGNLEMDVTELFVRVGEASKAAKKGWTLLIDEVQYIKKEELSATIVALHRTTQKGLPVKFFGAGLPQIAALTGNAKSYAERLFDFPPIGALSKDESYAALREPINAEGESIDSDALDEVYSQTQGYPYFLQEWGYQAWNTTEKSPIKRKDIVRATERAIQRLDDGFFRVRLDRLTPKEKEYVAAMADLGTGPYRSSDVADQLGQDVQSLGPCRAQIIRKGMIYSPAHGDIAFTVPLFEDFLQRIAAT